MLAEERDIQHRLREVVLGRVAAGRFAVPSMPEVAVRCLQMIRQPNFSLKQAATLLERDAGLVAQIVRIANSAAHGGIGGVRTIDAALMRLGMQKLRTVLIEASAQRVFTIDDKRVSDAFRGIWDHSRAVAVLARELCPPGKGLDPEGCYLAGLLHDVGKPVAASILMEAERAYAQAVRVHIGPETWLPVVLACHREVGATVAVRWNLPEAVASCIKDCRFYEKQDPFSVTNVVRLGNALAKKAGYYVGTDLDPQAIAAQIRAGQQILGIDDRTVDWLVGTIGERLRDND